MPFDGIRAASLENQVILQTNECLKDQATFSVI
jgi:hypothetical protein